MLCFINLVSSFCKGSDSKDSIMETSIFLEHGLSNSYEKRLKEALLQTSKEEEVRSLLFFYLL